MHTEVKGCFLTPDGRVRKGTVTVHGGFITACEYESDAEQTEWEASGVIVPGFIDVHVHGGGGADVMDATAEALDTISRTHGARGTTAWLATTVTHFEEHTDRAIDAVVAYMKSDRNGKHGAKVLGLHLEGPYLNPKLRGAHLEDALRRPDVEQFIRWCDRAEGAIKMITMAPELEGADEVIQEAVRRGIVVSAGHSNATVADMEKATSLGVSHVTHLFNAMRPLHHREPGIIGYTLSHASLTADLIADGIHLHPAIVDTVIAAKGADKLLLITDAMRAACMGDGIYESGGLQVHAVNGEARLADGTLAGSMLTIDAAYRRVVQQHHVSLHEASQMASRNPAALLKLDHVQGQIEVGMRADMVCLQADGKVRWTLVSGQSIYRY